MGTLLNRLLEEEPFNVFILVVARFCSAVESSESSKV